MQVNLEPLLCASFAPIETAEASNITEVKGRRTDTTTQRMTVVGGCYKKSSLSLLLSEFLYQSSSPVFSTNHWPDNQKIKQGKKLNPVSKEAEELQHRREINKNIIQWFKNQLKKKKQYNDNASNITNAEILWMLEKYENICSF